MGDTTVTNTQSLSFMAVHGGSLGTTPGQSCSGRFCFEASEDEQIDGCVIKEGSMEKKMPF